MAIRVTCPGCQNSYSVTEDLLGKTIRCKDCQETFVARAAKAATVAAGRGDSRTQRAAARDQRTDDDFEPVNGTQRKQPAPASGGNNTALIVGGSIAGVTILGLIGALAFVLMNRPEPSNPTPPPLPVVVHTPAPTPPAPPTPDVKPSDDKPAETKIATETKPANVAESKPAETKNPTAQMVTTAQILGGVRMPRPANFKPEVVERAKKSAVMLTCHFEQGLSWGSGWVAEKNGNERYIVTNAHVVGMKEREKPKPDKIEVTFFIGTPQQRVLEGTLLALDREEDLAVVRVKGPDLPDPLPIAPSFDLRETEKLMTMGFPLGGRLKDILGRGLGVDVVTTLKTREAPVTGRVFNKDGSVKYIQVEGGADPGNSGGAAVDTNGNLSAVVVAQAPGTNMKFVIPSEYVLHLLAGRILRVIPGQAVISGSTIQQPIKAFIADPLKRLRSVSVDVWAGLKPEKGSEIRPASATQPSPEPGDGPHITATLNWNPDQPVKIGEPYPASAELSLPALKEGQVYWFQPRYVSKDGKERWGEAVVMEMGRYPVEAKPAMIAIKHKPDLKPDDVRKLELFSRGVTGLELEGIGSLGSDLSLKAYLTEKTTLVDKNGDAKVRLKYTDLRLSDDDENVIFRKALRGVMESVKNLATDITVTRTGKFVSPKPDFAEVPQRARDVLGRFNSQIVESLEILSLVLPNKEVQPGETWSFETAYTIMFMNNKSENALFKTTCKYIGTRVRDGRPEAVIELSGSVVRNNSAGGSEGSGSGKAFGIGGSAGNAPGSDEPTDEEGRRKRGVWGVSYGAAVIDLETGLVTIARNESDIVVGTQVAMRGPNNEEANVDAFLGFYLDTLLQRGLTKEPLKTVENPATVLPNMVRVYNPLVGVGEPLSAEIPKSTDVAPEVPTLMRPEILRKAQKAAVLIHVEAGDGGGGSGSGWFAEPGIVVTNCHVVDMLSKSSRKPERITVVLDSGTSNERKLPGKLLTINRTDDLAVIKVEGDNLPEPLKIVPSESLVETTRLTILGFPLGRNLARQLGIGLNARDLQTTLKTRTTTVSGRVVQADQSTKYVQLEGGADPGNSGGAIVDKDGNVRLVLVAGIPGTQLVFGIPSEYPARLLQGWPIEIEPDYAYLDGSTARQPVRIHFTDPLRRVGKASIDVWVGTNGKPRKPTDKEPARAAADSVRETFPLRLEPDPSGLFIDAVGEFPLPPRSAGQVYWLQPRFINGTGKEQWGQAIPYSPDGPPVERKPVVLQHKMPKLGAERTLELTSQAIFQWQQLTERHVEGYPLKATIIEKFQPPRFGVTRVQMSYKDLIWDLPLPEGIPQPVVSVIRNLLKQFTDSIKGVVTEMSITKEGLYKAPVTDYSRVPLERLLFTKTFNDQLMQSLIAMSIPFPNKEMKFRDTWEHPTNLFIETRNRYEPSLFNMKFRYLGVRDRGGRTEAVIEIEGALAKDDKAKAIGEKELKADQPGGESPEPSPPPPNDPNKPPLREQQARGQSKSRGMYGLAKGHAYIDVQSGYVAEVKLFIDVDVEMTVKDPTSKQDIPVPAGGTMEVLLKRLPSASNR